MVACRRQQEKPGDESALWSVILSSADYFPDSQVTPTQQVSSTPRWSQGKKIDTEVSSPCSRWYHIAEAGFNLGPIHVIFATENVVLEQDSLRLPWGFPTNIFPETLRSDLYFKTFVGRKSGRRIETFKESNALSDVSMEQRTERRFRTVPVSERHFEHSLNKIIETLRSFPYTSGYPRWRQGRTPKRRRELSWEAARWMTWVACRDARIAGTSLTGRTFPSVAPNICGLCYRYWACFLTPIRRPESCGDS